jgi:hypothetical protein
MKGIYLPTFQRSIILQANEGYKKFTRLDNLALFPTYLSFFTAERLSCFKNLAIVHITSGFGSK